MAKLNEKKARFEAVYQQSRRRKKIVLSAFVSVLILGIAVMILSTREAIPGFDNKYSIGKSMDYKNQKIEMTEVTPTIEDGRVSISLEDLKKSSILYLMYDPNYDVGNGQKGLPLMAYLTPAGRITVAVSFCEPCYSRKFRIEGDVLVCNVCNTRWAMADLTGLSGGCPKYPPDELNYTVEESTGKIYVEETELKDWKPRDYDASTTSEMKK
ncbi:putative membrane protein (DUF2318) [Desulfitobacterium dichloroeliminans LMG P-21439]|uniref:Putative membrane protein (DUF2318) n=1 Tax=Desulfitobacterium dichloroeliminans (strain LMG P-21439 / DCA1) TaxID=871963 RepID=L0F659_DESDL|nr:Fe-S-containing protein [Desulfitobacterium dichloroeliminans]AGA68667.1 putative membrane protein (DUF2318) [Desulfitobacterium dichloroeliminans LMG P-21439]